MLAAAVGALLPLSIAACGLDALGGATTSSDASPVEGDGGILDDVVTTLDGAVPVPDDDDDDDDDDDVDASCERVLIDDQLDRIDESRWLVTKNGAAGSFPAATVLSGTPVVALIDRRNYARAGLWLKTPVPLVSFDVTFRVGIGCTRYRFSTSCADGVAASWLDATDPSIGNEGAYGASFGIPTGVQGGAAAIDIHQATFESAPAVRLIRLDRFWAPSNASLRVANGPRTPSLVGQVHEVHVRLREGTTSVYVDGNLHAQGTVAGVPQRGIFGFSAGTASEHSLSVIWQFRGRFRACEP